MLCVCLLCELLCRFDLTHEMRNFIKIDAFHNFEIVVLQNLTEIPECCFSFRVWKQSLFDDLAKNDGTPPNLRDSHSKWYELSHHNDHSLDHSISYRACFIDLHHGYLILPFLSFAFFTTWTDVNDGPNWKDRQSKPDCSLRGSPNVSHETFAMLISQMHRSTNRRIDESTNRWSWKAALEIDELYGMSTNTLECEFVADRIGEKDKTRRTTDRMDKMSEISFTNMS
jgi:hypothetical protein